jgi:carboxyl-terminal processing protease
LAKSYPTFEDFYKQYSVPESLLNTILKKAAEKEIRPKDEEDKKATLDQLAFTLKALVAYDLWDRNEYLRIINERDDIVKRALQLLKENYEISASSYTSSR